MSPRTHNSNLYHQGNAVLAVWPTLETLDFAEGLALGGALCIIPGTIDDVRSWVSRTSAQSLWAGVTAEPLATLPNEVKRSLDSIITFDGQNDFIGAGGKEKSIRNLRALVRDGYRPDPADLENYVLATGRIRSSKGAQRLREWYEGILKGKRFRDYAGRTI